MASVPVDFATTKEKINFACLGHLLTVVGSTVLRDAFDSIHPPSTLHMVLSSPSVFSTLRSLIQNGVLRPLQWRKLFPADALTVSSADFDIGLLMVLFRNICGLSPPFSTGHWNRLPPDSDNSFEANIVRINWYRNDVVNDNAKASVDDPTFNAQWQKISTAILALASRTNNYTMYAASISRLKTAYMDPAAEASSLKVWNDQGKKDHDSLKEMGEELKVLC